MFRDGSEQGDFRKSLQAFHQAHAQLGRSRGDRSTGGCSGPCGRRRNADARQREQQPTRCGDAAVEGGEQATDQESGQERDRRRGEHPQVEVVEGLDVGDDAVEDVPAAEAPQPGRGERLDAPVEPHPQAFEDPEGGLVGEDSLGVAGRRSQDGEEAHPDAGQEKVEQDRCRRRKAGNGRGRNEPPRKRHEPHGPGTGRQQAGQAAESQTAEMPADDGCKRAELLESF